MGLEQIPITFITLIFGINAYECHICKAILFFFAISVNAEHSSQLYLERLQTLHLPVFCKEIVYFLAPVFYHRSCS